MGLFNRIIGVIVRPKETIEEITNSAPVWQSIAVTVVLGLISIFVTMNENMLLKNIGVGLSPYDLNIFSSMIPMFMTMGVFSAMIVNPLFRFVGVGIYNLIAEFLGNKGNGKGLFAAFGFTSIPSLLSIIIYAVFVSLNLQFVSMIVSLLIVIWIVVLNIIAIKSAYGMGTGKATLTFFIPYIASIVVIGMFIILTTITFIPIFQQISGQFMF